MIDSPSGSDTSPPVAANSIEIRWPDEHVPAQAANWFAFSFVGEEYQLLIGYMDIRKFAEASQRPNEGGSLAPELLHRLYMGPQAFQILRAQIEELGRQRDAQTVAQQGGI